MNKKSKFGRMYKRYIPFVTSPNDNLNSKSTYTEVEGIRLLTSIDANIFSQIRSKFLTDISKRGMYSKFTVSSEMNFLSDGMCAITGAYGNYQNITMLELTMTYEQKLLFDSAAKENTIFSSFIYNENTDKVNVLVMCAYKHTVSEYNLRNSLYIELQDRYTYKKISDSEFKLV